MNQNPARGECEYKMNEKKKTNWKKITVKNTISFVDLSQMYGRAEFTFCPVFKHGKCDTIYIQALQQEREDKFFVLELKDYKINCLHIESWSYKGIEAPRIWRQFWCKEHKCLTNEVYVPPKTSKIVFGLNFGNTLTVRFEE